MGRRKNIVAAILTLLFIIPYNTYAQINITPFAGRNYTYIECQRVCSRLPEDGFKNNTWSVGIKIEKVINPKLSTSIAPDFTKKTTNYIWNGYGDWDTCDTINNINLKYYQTNIPVMANYKVIGNWYISSGVNFRFFYHAILKHSNLDEHRVPYDIQYRKYNDPQFNMDWSIATSYNFKNIVFELRYSQSILKKKIWNPDYHIALKNTDIFNKSIDISVGYLINVMKKRRRNKVSCPKM